MIDADALARDVVAPGTPGLKAVVDEFGARFLTPEGALDRPAMAALVFADPARRAALEAIVHPLVAQRSAALLASAPADSVVVYDVPLLAETMSTTRAGGHEFDVVVVVTCPRDVRVQRLVGRGLSQDDAERRIDAQATDEQRLALADLVVDNSGSLADLDRAVERVWARLQAST